MQLSGFGWFMLALGIVGIVGILGFVLVAAGAGS